MGKQKPDRRRKRLQVYGLLPKNFPRTVAWKIDQDYTEYLTEEEARWLARFNDSHYGAAFGHDRSGTWSPALRRVVYVEKNAANRDLYEITKVSGLLGYQGDSSGESPADANTKAYVDLEQVDISPTPAYLNSPEYKQVLAEVRATAPRKLKDKPTQAHIEARKKLERIVHGYPEEQ